MAADIIQAIHDWTTVNRMKFKDNIIGNKSFRNAIMDNWISWSDQKVSKFLNLDFLADVYWDNRNLIDNAIGYNDISATAMKLTNIDGRLQLLIQQNTEDWNMVSIYEVPAGRKIEEGDILDIAPGLI